LIFLGNILKKELKMKIQLVETSFKKYGGNIYERFLAEILEKNFHAEIHNIGVKEEGKLRYLNAIKYFQSMYRISKKKLFDISIKPYQASIFLNKGNVKNVVLIRHIDSNYSSLLTKFYQNFLEFYLRFNREKINSIIVVSKYWEKYLQNLGFSDIYLLYNQFNLKDFIISDIEVENFKKRYSLSNKPIVYLGNPQKKKGVDLAFKAIKDLDAQFITSGTGDLSIKNVKNLNLNYKEYITLLKSSDVVLTMSQFNEGWCRVAHEAMLCKTPVVGSGSGGMKELLEGGQQIIVNDFSELKNSVKLAIKNKSILGESGFQFAKNFSLEKFENDLIKILKKIKKN